MTATTGHLDCAPETGLCLGRVGVSFAQKQFPPPATDLGRVYGFEGLLGNLGQRFHGALNFPG